MFVCALIQSIFAGLGHSRFRVRVIERVLAILFERGNAYFKPRFLVNEFLNVVDAHSFVHKDRDRGFHFVDFLANAAWKPLVFLFGKFFGGFHKIFGFHVEGLSMVGGFCSSEMIGFVRGNYIRSSLIVKQIRKRW